MAKIARKTAKIFGQTAGINQIAEFGSLAAGTPAFTTDPDVIQALSNYLGGWFQAVIGANSPAIEDMNALCYLFAYQIAYTMQAGIPEWDTNTTYFTGSLVQSGLFIYQSIADNNQGNVISNGAFWRLFSGGSASGLDIVEQKNEIEYFGIITDPIDNSVESGFQYPPASYVVQGLLHQTYTSGTTSASIVWGPPLVLNPADPNTTLTTNWSLFTNASTLTTSATTKVGATSVSFTKTNGGVTSLIKYDRGAPNMGISGYTKLFVWLDFSSAAGINSVTIVIDTDGTGTNFQTYNVTTNSAGGAFVTGFNEIKLDLTATAGTPTGTGWNPALAFQTLAIGITTALAATVPVVLVNGLWFGLDTPENFVSPGTQLAIFDATNEEIIKIDSVNTLVQGIAVTLTTALTNNYSGGFGQTSIYRSNLTIGSGQAGMGTLDPQGNTLAGAVQTAQYVSLSRILRSALSGNTMSSSISVSAPQTYPSLFVNPGNLIVSDPSNTTANLLTGDVVHVFQTIYDDGLANFIYRGDMTLTGNATWSLGQATLPGTPPGGSAVGDFVVKKNLASAEISCVATGANENFVTLSPNVTPDGILLYDTGLPIPNPGNLYALYSLSQTRRNLYGVGPTLTQTGSPILNAPFLNGQYAASNWSASNYFMAVGSAAGGGISNPAVLAVSIWYYPVATSSKSALQAHTGSNGWVLLVQGGGAALVQQNGATLLTGGVLTQNAWNHIAFVALGTNGANQCHLWVNGARVNDATGTAAWGAGADLQIGWDNVGGSGLPAGDRLAQLAIWTGLGLSDAQVTQIYNAGKARVMGFNGNLKYRYTNTGIAGSRLSMRAKLVTDTTAILPAITQMGTIKTQ